ncbi:MAG: hypothetical protein KAS82_03470 [Bacteroidales bacterium]|nr:hypothetical protein [Bacteroidales bacterium]
MDFEIGNILYIVITLVVVIVGLMGRKKKPAGGTGEPGSEAQPGFMENLERVLKMGQEESLVADVEPFEEDLPVEESAQVPAAESVSDVMKRTGIMDDYDRIMNRRTDGDPDLIMAEGVRTTEAMEVVDLDYIPGTDYFEIVKDFDAGTAVVYSAIINRLDY